jgi:hypothetical protein
MKKEVIGCDYGATLKWLFTGALWSITVWQCVSLVVSNMIEINKIISNQKIANTNILNIFACNLVTFHFWFEESAVETGGLVFRCVILQPVSAVIPWLGISTILRFRKPELLCFWTQHFSVALVLVTKLCQDLTHWQCPLSQLQDLEKLLALPCYCSLLRALRLTTEFNRKIPLGNVHKQRPNAKRKHQTMT